MPTLDLKSPVFQTLVSPDQVVTNLDLSYCFLALLPMGGKEEMMRSKE